MLSLNSPEFQLLLQCGRSNPCADRIEQIVAKGVDWSAVLKLADRHGMRPLLRASLVSSVWSSVPPTVQVILERFHRANTHETLGFAAEVIRLTDIFQHNDLPVVVFKGVVLAQTVYGDLSLREMGDLDFLVREQD